ncbi:hypothetical protein H0A36_26765 [Endozoicomonas sp. SM1973]|uniref:Uncharacterized protein n=1 Tax=Spartinivicinus marinus TaxID=2994442 RepID=A0A853ICN9_9GAMM|nr:hypothetical protein [Spartinivicinus marinus]MCX4024748.1 hypothetical protein [Spartinivicinus marinus]NYZ69622.1 hypothetical protein [Spartinivicinus marinus]
MTKEHEISNKLSVETRSLIKELLGKLQIDISSLTSLSSTEKVKNKLSDRAIKNISTINKLLGNSKGDIIIVEFETPHDVVNTIDNLEDKLASVTDKVISLYSDYGWATEILQQKIQDSKYLHKYKLTKIK